MGQRKKLGVEEKAQPSPSLIYCGRWQPHLIFALIGAIEAREARVWQAGAEFKRGTLSSARLLLVGLTGIITLRPGLHSLWNILPLSPPVHLSNFNTILLLAY